MGAPFFVDLLKDYLSLLVDLLASVLALQLALSLQLAMSLHASELPLHFDISMPLWASIILMQAAFCSGVHFMLSQ